MGLNNRSSPIGLVNWILPTTHFVLAVPVNTVPAAIQAINCGLKY